MTIAQCSRTDSFGRQCALVAGHGIAFHAHARGVVIDGHLYPGSAGEDLSEEIRTQLRLDANTSLTAERDAALATAHDLRNQVQKLTTQLDIARLKLADAVGERDILAKELERLGRVRGGKEQP